MLHMIVRLLRSVLLNCASVSHQHRLTVHWYRIESATTYVRSSYPSQWVWKVLGKPVQSMHNMKLKIVQWVPEMLFPCKPREVRYEYFAAPVNAC